MSTFLVTSTLLLHHVFFFPVILAASDESKGSTCNTSNVFQNFRIALGNTSPNVPLFFVEGPRAPPGAPRRVTHLPMDVRIRLLSSQQKQRSQAVLCQTCYDYHAFTLTVASCLSTFGVEHTSRDLPEQPSNTHSF